MCYPFGRGTVARSGFFSEQKQALLQPHLPLTIYYFKQSHDVGPVTREYKSQELRVEIGAYRKVQTAPATLYLDPQLFVTAWNKLGNLPDFLAFLYIIKVALKGSEFALEHSSTKRALRQLNFLKSVHKLAMDSDWNESESAPIQTQMMQLAVDCLKQPKLTYEFIQERCAEIWPNDQVAKLMWGLAQRRERFNTFPPAGIPPRPRLTRVASAPVAMHELGAGQHKRGPRCAP